MAKQDRDSSSLQNVPHIDSVVVITSKKQATWGCEEARERQREKEEVGNLEEEVERDKGSVEIVIKKYIFPWNTKSSLMLKTVLHPGTVNFPSRC